MKLLFAFLISINAWAQKPGLTVVDQDLEVQPLKESFDVNYAGPSKSTLPSKEERDGFLESVKETKNWDELKRDLFYMDLKSKDLRELKTRYPEISEIVLRRLKARRK